MDVLRSLANLIVMGVASLVVAFFWWIYHPDQEFKNIFFLAILVVWLLVWMGSGLSHRRRH